MGDYLNYSAASANSALDAAQARASSRTARNQAYAQAYNLEDDATTALSFAGDNLMRMQQNKQLRLSAQRNAQASSGFLHSGSKLAAEKSLADIIDTAIADQMQSASSQASQKYAQANLLRHHGTAQLTNGNIQSAFYSSQATANKQMASAALIGQSLTTLGGFTSIFNL